MPSSAQQIFNGITPAQYTRLAEKARTAGIELNGDSGTASKFGVEITWTYEPQPQRLTIQVLKTPFFLSAADVDAKIQTLVMQSAACERNTQGLVV